MDSAAKKSAGPLHLHALPDDLLLRILKQPVFSQADRLHRLPLVCTRWARLAPQAVESAECYAEYGDCSTCLLSLFIWLAKHGAAGSLRRLHLGVDPGSDEPEEGGALHEQAIRALLVHSVLPACSRLHELHLYIQNTPLGLEGWAAHLTHLRCLTLFTEAEVRVTAQLQGLTRLQELSLSGDGLTFSEGAVLPPSLTQLSLERLSEDRLPPQLAALTALQALDLSLVHMAAGGYDGLTALTWLKRLRLVHNTHLPSCLSALTQLSALHLADTPSRQQATPAETTAAQEEAVGALPNLVHLTMSVHGDEETDHVLRLPAALSALSRLQSLVWGAPPADYPALPPGPYLASLTRLAPPTPAAVASLQQLSEQAGQLAQLTLLHEHYNRPGDAEGRVAVACWAGHHAPLQCLRMDGASRTPALKTACQQAQQRKPGLQIDF